MEPKEKAIELVNKYSKFFDRAHYGRLQSLRCALILVNEIIDQWEYVDVYLADGGGKLNFNLKYWYEVKIELNKMI